MQPRCHNESYLRSFLRHVCTALLQILFDPPVLQIFQDRSQQIDCLPAVTGRLILPRCNARVLCKGACTAHFFGSLCLSYFENRDS